MKKLPLLITIFIFFIHISFADDTKKIPVKFSKNCYEFISEFKNITHNSYIINSFKKIDTFISENKIISHKLYKNFGGNIDYEININGNKKYLQDDNDKTFLEIDTEKNKEIIIEFKNLLKADSFSVDFVHNTHYDIQYFSSEDGIIYNKISTNIYDFDLKFLKIKFENEDNLRKKIKITTLSFKSKTYEYIVNKKGNIKAYSNNICKNNYPNLSNNVGDFNIDKNTKTIHLSFRDNIDLDIFKKQDFDKDGIEDTKDNCINIYNPMQKDKNGNGRGDSCSDDDNDEIVGYLDNCINIKNSDQKDLNRNGVGDVCEFDKDKDSIFDSIDNCINAINKNQKDTDKDGIGDICDNSIYYNPTQLDKNNNGIGDITEQKERQLKENDDDFDGIENYKDNCRNIANPNQLDSDKDGIGNSCDNCKNIQNKNQLDLAKNGVGDICEDSDSDGIEGLIDNCINIVNPDQKDDDNNGIGNLCEDKDHDNILFANDNCPYVHNPNQENIDDDEFGDLCDSDDDRFVESNKEFFIAIILLLVAIFGGGIYIMIRKLK